MADSPSPQPVAPRPASVGRAPSPSAAQAPEPDQPSFEQAYEQHFEFVWASLRALGLAGPSLEDGVQDVFLIVHRRLDGFESRSSLRTWLYGIARHVAHNYHRRQRRKGGSEPLNPSLPAEDPGPEDQAADDETLRFVQKFVATLSERQRDVFVLCDVQELSAPEVAEMLGLKPNTVYSRLRAARRAFGQAIAERNRKQV